MMNQLGDHQMETYFESAHSNGGMVCDGEKNMDKVFNKIQEIHKKSFRDIDGEYIKRDEEEKICAIRLPPTVFFKVLLRLGPAFILRCRRRQGVGFSQFWC